MTREMLAAKGGTVGKKVLIYCKIFLFPFKQVLVETTGWVCLFRNNVESPSLSNRSLCYVAMMLSVASHTASQYEH